MPIDNSNIAWCFTGDTLSDGKPIPLINQTIKFSDNIQIYKSGYNWSKYPTDALSHAGCHDNIYMLHRIYFGGEIIEKYNDGVSSELTILATIDASQLLLRYAADLALSLSHLYEIPDVVKEYLTTLNASTLKISHITIQKLYNDLNISTNRKNISDLVILKAIETAYNCISHDKFTCDKALNVKMSCIDTHRHISIMNGYKIFASRYYRNIPNTFLDFDERTYTAFSVNGY
jgi:hypothetical protein